MYIHSCHNEPSPKAEWQGYAPCAFSQLQVVCHKHKQLFTCLALDVVVQGIQPFENWVKASFGHNHWKIMYATAKILPALLIFYAST